MALDDPEKDTGPSLPLLEEWRGDGLSWEEFSRSYAAEVSAQQPLLSSLRRPGTTGTVTLLCDCQNETHCHRTLLKRIIEGVDNTSGPGPGREPASRGE